MFVCINLQQATTGGDADDDDDDDGGADGGSGTGVGGLYPDSDELTN